MARLIECIPNFSCSKEKDEATYNELVKTAQKYSSWRMVMEMRLLTSYTKKV